MDDNDQLIALRGAGRYFGNEESTSEEPVCYKCQEPGHLAQNCKTIICSSCGEKDGHLSKDCPKRLRCSKCSAFGHRRDQCTVKGRFGLKCSKCGSNIHSSDTCPSIWRFYKVKSNADIRYPREIHCYNCGNLGHYGDECSIPRPVVLRYREDSAFSGNTLHKSLQRRYFDETERFRQWVSRGGQLPQESSKNRGPRMRRGQKREKRQRGR